jgi:lysozyme family protein
LRADVLPAGVWGSASSSAALGSIGEEVDGCISPETLTAAAKSDPRTLVNDLAERQAAYYRSLCDFPTFGAGWLSRTTRAAMRH